MAVFSLNHVNIRTTNMQSLIDFYATVLGCAVGKRPPFDVRGAWLYSGDQAVIHLVEMERPLDTGEPQVEHFALSGTGLADYLAHLRAHHIPYHVLVAPEFGLRQVNIYDPDGNHFEVIYGAHEEADLRPYEGD